MFDITKFVYIVEIYIPNLKKKVFHVFRNYVRIIQIRLFCFNLLSKLIFIFLFFKLKSNFRYYFN